MARVIGNPFGELRGKLAGNVFSRTKAGPIVREYIKPTNRNSIGQVNARANFGTASMGYGMLSDAQKSAWNGFAADLARFNPVKTVNNGQYSGFQAYQSLKMVVDSNLQFYETPVTIDTHVVQCTKLNFLGLPPEQPLVGNVKWETDGDIASLRLDYCRVNNGVVQLRIVPSIMPPNWTAPRELRDSVGNLFGFKLYMSSPIFGGQTRPKVEMQNVIMDFGTITLPAITTDPPESMIEFSWQCDTNPLTDARASSRQFTLFAVGVLGNMKRIGSCLGTFSPSV